MMLYEQHNFSAFATGSKKASGGIVRVENGDEQDLGCNPIPTYLGVSRTECNRAYFYSILLL